MPNPKDGERQYGRMVEGTIWDFSIARRRRTKNTNQPRLPIMGNSQILVINMRMFKSESCGESYRMSATGRFANDNALLRRAKFRDTARVWVLALGAVVGWCAVMELSK